MSQFIRSKLDPCQKIQNVKHLQRDKYMLEKKEIPTEYDNVKVTEFQFQTFFPCFLVELPEYFGKYFYKIILLVTSIFVKVTC